MASQWKVGTDNLVSVDLGPYDIYGQSAGFVLSHKKSDATFATITGATWSEITYDVSGSPLSITTSGETPAGSATITVVNATGVQAGQVFNNGNVYFYVSSVAGNTITLRRVTESIIADATTFNKVGNTGIYQTTLNLGTVGQYTLLISNPDVGLLNEATKVEVVTNTLDDVASSITTESTTINNKLDNIGSTIGVVDTSISGKLII